MAGFFRQTAQRAHASGSQLHSSAALPYAAAREAQGAGSWRDDTLGAPADARSVGVGVGVAAAGSPTATNALLRTRDDKETQPLPRKARRSAPIPKNRTVRPSPRSNARASKTLRSIVEHVISIAPPASPPQAKTAFLPQVMTPAAATHTSGSTTPTPSSTLRKNKPVRPQSRIQKHAARKKAASPAQQIQANAPEVHIHIGRVELTANTTAASVPKRESASDRRPLSLDDYLQQRRSSRRTGTP